MNFILIAVVIVFIISLIALFASRLRKRETYTDLDELNEQNEIQNRISRRKSNVQEYREVPTFDVYKLLSIVFGITMVVYASYYFYNQYFVKCTGDWSLKVSFEKLLEVCNTEIEANGKAYDELEDQQTVIANQTNEMRKVRDDRANKLNIIIQEDEVAFPTAEE